MFITAVSGAVGQTVGQLAKMHRMKVIGSTGSREKVAFASKELGCMSFIQQIYHILGNIWLLHVGKISKDGSS